MSIGLPFYVGNRVSYQQDFGVIKLAEIESGLAAILFDGNRLVQYELQTLVEAYQNRELNLINDHVPVAHGVLLTDKDKKTIRYREAFCKEAHKSPTPTCLDMLNEIIPVVVLKFKFTKQPSAKTIQRWYGKWAKDQFDMGTQVFEAKAGKRNYRLSTDIETVITNMIDQFYYKSGGIKQKVIVEVRTKLIELGYATSQIPCDRTIRKRIADIDRIKAEEKINGVLAAAELKRGTYRHHPDYRCCERVELDVGHFNIGQLDDNGYFLGGLSIAIVLDVGTRVITGHALLVSSKKKEDEDFVFAAMLHSLIRKKDPNYPYNGIGDVYFRDSGPGYKGVNFNKFIEYTLQSCITIAPTRQGWAKPFVEAIVKFLRRALNMEVEGYIGKFDPKKYTEATLIKNAKYTVRQLEEKMHKVIYNYHHTKHSGLKGETPHEAWVRKSNEHPPKTLDFLVDQRNLRRTLPTTRKLHHVKGITYKYQWFNSPEIQKLYHRLHGNRDAKNVQIHVEVNLYDARWINVIHPYTGEIIEVPNTLQLVDRISFDELNAHLTGIKYPLEVATRIDVEKRIKARNKQNRRGSRTELIPLNAEVDFDAMYRAEQSPHERLADQDKLESGIIINDSKHPTTLEVPTKEDRYRKKSSTKDSSKAKSKPTNKTITNKKPKSGGFKIV